MDDVELMGAIRTSELPFVADDRLITGTANVDYYISATGRQVPRARPAGQHLPLLTLAGSSAR